MREDNARPGENGGLATDALGLAESVAMGVAGTAPACSVAATTATLVAAVGVLSPASLLYCGLVMFGIAFAFMHLNSAMADAGASFTWVSKVFGPGLGFIAGWSVLVASAAFLVSGTIPAATATLTLLSPRHADEPIIVTLVAAAWLVAVSLIVVKGIKPASYTQIAMIVFEVGTLIVVMVAAVIHFGSRPAHAMSWNWFSLAGFSPSSFASGALTAVFLFWGWDVTLNLNEETRNPSRAPGRSGVLAMAIVLLLFVGFAVTCLLALSDEEIQQSSTNVLFAIADKLFPRPWSYAAALAVMLSTIGTLETAILQFTRTLFAQARNGAVHERYAMVHGRWKTPWVATLTIAMVALVLLIMSSQFASMSLLVKDSVNAIGFQVACYYSLAAFACAWHFRKKAFESFMGTLSLFLWPASGAAMLAFIAAYSIPTFDLATNLLGLGGIAIGIIPWLLRRRISGRSSALPPPVVLSPNRGRL